MEKLLRLVAEQNRFFDPKDNLSRMIDRTLRHTNSELTEDNLFYVQAARGLVPSKPADQRKRSEQI